MSTTTRTIDDGVNGSFWYHCRNCDADVPPAEVSIAPRSSWVPFHQWDAQPDGDYYAHTCGAWHLLTTDRVFAGSTDLESTAREAHGEPTGDETEHPWEAYGLGGSWKGLAVDEADARRKAHAGGVLAISWIEATP